MNMDSKPIINGYYYEYLRTTTSKHFKMTKNKNLMIKLYMLYNIYNK